jgi:hypothetical protein
MRFSTATGDYTHSPRNRATAPTVSAMAMLVRRDKPA